VTDVDRFRHDASPYERPNFPYRCGRAAAWGEPCPRGPGIDGRCGGVADCTPVQRDGRYECRRSPALGGPCTDGPQPDGRCSIQRTPCEPVPNLRLWRGRFVAAAMAAALALIVLLLGTAFDSRDPGPLSAEHAMLVGPQGCGACHGAHGQGAATFFAAIAASENVSAKCVDCHDFPGGGMRAHNAAAFAGKPGVPATSCTMCHTEHQGSFGNLTTIASAQCATCHERKFRSFAEAHPPFRPTYPQLQRDAIVFGHASHLEKHFREPAFAERAPAGCTACHAVTDAGRAVLPRGFETCEACHGEQIAKRPLPALALPEMDENRVDPARLAAACGSVPEDEAYSAISLELATPLAAYLLAADADDPVGLTEPMQELLQALAENGADALGGLLAKALPGVRPADLLSGLGPEQVRQLACAWAANREYEPPAGPAFGGWLAEPLQLSYVATRHADPVMKAWLDAVATARPPEAAEQRERFERLRRQFLSASEGPGACVKCHSVGAAAGAEGEAGRLAVEWRYDFAVTRDRHTRYNHAPHINLMGPDVTCGTCHKVDREADYQAAFRQLDRARFVPSFKPIDIATCRGCHAETLVPDDCATCHVYHGEHGFKTRMMRDGT